MAYDVAQLDSSLDLQRAQVPLSGDDLVVQRLRARLNTHCGEVPKDKTKGIIYLDEVQRRPFRRTLVTASLVSEIRSTPGVGAVTDIVSSYSPETSSYSFTCNVFADDSSEAIKIGIEARGSVVNQAPWAVFIRGV